MRFLGVSQSTTVKTCGIVMLLIGIDHAAFAKPPVQTMDDHLKLNEPSRFASYVISYQPGDGQFVNDPDFNDPQRSLGPPIGGGTSTPDNSKLVTLGDHGGSITLGFDTTVWDHPDNPFGLDCIVFSNANWIGGNPNLRWAEAAVIEISRDVNHNGIADDAWYLVPGSDIVDPINQRQNGSFLLPDDPFASGVLFNPFVDGTERYWGYGEMTPTLLLGDLDADNVIDNPELNETAFYTMPDDPFAVGITLGSGGGDAFDIAWAIDPLTSEPAGLRGFDFIRLSTGADGEAGQLGEISAEIGGVAMVSPWLQRPSRFLHRFRDLDELDMRRP